MELQLELNFNGAPHVIRCSLHSVIRSLHRPSRPPLPSLDLTQSVIAVAVSRAGRAFWAAALFTQALEQLLPYLQLPPYLQLVSDLRLLPYLHRLPYLQLPPYLHWCKLASMLAPTYEWL